METNEHNTFPVWKVLPGLLIALLLPIICLFLISGQWDWWEGWVFVLISGLVTISGRLILIKKHPGLAFERASYKEKENVQEWDKKLMPFVAIYGPLLIWIATGLDKRFSTAPTLPWPVEITALVLILLGYIFSTWAMLENQFFAAIVRIQNDREHKVIDSGPYAIVRHPGYAGSFIAALFIPLALSTYWVFIPVIFANTFVIIRTAKEDQFLQQNLEGYAEYAKSKTRFRLIPGIW